MSGYKNPYRAKVIDARKSFCFHAFQKVKVLAAGTKVIARAHLKPAQSNSLKRVVYQYIRGTMGEIGRAIGGLCNGTVWRLDGLATTGLSEWLA
jgi:hypothetical protein